MRNIFLGDSAAFNTQSHSLIPPINRVKYRQTELWLLRVSGSCWTGIPEFTGPMQWPSGAPQGTWERRRQSREHQPQAWECQPQAREHMRAQVTNLEALSTRLAARTSVGAHWIMVKQCGQNIIIIKNTAVVAGYHSYYLLFNNFKIFCIQFVISCMYLYSYPSTNGMSRLAVGCT